MNRAHAHQWERYEIPGRFTGEFCPFCQEVRVNTITGLRIVGRVQNVHPEPFASTRVDADFLRSIGIQP